MGRVKGTLAALVAAGSLIAAATPARAAAPLRVDGARIADQAGRTVILRGVNVNGLGDYWQARPEIPSTIPLTRADFDQIASLGLNSVRLLVHWSRLEPAPGTFSDAYLAEIRQAVGWARAAGLKVVLDIHQDAWAKFVAAKPGEFCLPPFGQNVGFDGAPQWATMTDGLPNCRLVARELSPSVMRAWQSFWTNRKPQGAGPGALGIRDEFVRTWGWLAGAFRDDPTVVGYDLLNEPNWGEDYTANACGDPHNFSSPSSDLPTGLTGNVVRIRCGDAARPAGIPAGFHPDSQPALSRPYPRAYPGTAAFRADIDARRLVVEGSASATDAPLEVWVPGSGWPDVRVQGLRIRVRIARPGGWIVRAAPLGGAYRLVATGAGPLPD